MKDGKYVVLAALCTLTLCIKVAAQIPLDMAPDAVDDMYEGCAKDALNKFVLSDFLQVELNNSKSFREAWLQAESSDCTKLIPGGLKQHTTALRTIIEDDHYLLSLNYEVYEYGTNVTTYEDFNYKSLHFLLMDSIKHLDSGLANCKTVYSFSDLDFIAQNGSTVRLGRFWIGYPSLERILKERDLNNEVILSITTCFSADLGENICNEESVTLISPAEEFTVEDVRVVKDPDTFTSIVLKHSQMKSMHNCYIFSRCADSSPHWLFLVLLTPSFFIIS
ncbi:GPI-linked NAD(P)(+)--arginine ADP-ribosyltransferase 1 [Boleophthalmus pectinirostris]|uniref:GPI-linked NAD(P)(+)--arginine ADP-ribosyltransferase 1 n=1 Tax=Boleophthalmus pectinirostris TaxID=150288 RepID=UPI000A1C57FD|nr:GPI-linked NAD(P)(+)--arginine ADP-ribosyltransferase 1 [Boleophthalmus pectinirostris]